MKCLRAGRCGERTERCQWQKKRSERVAAVKISSVRRKAAQKFWAPQQGHRPLRRGYMGCGMAGRNFLNFWGVARERATGEATERKGRE